MSYLKTLTGSEPAELLTEEVVPEVEAPEMSTLTTVSSGSISVNVVSNNIINTVQMKYYGRDEYGDTYAEVLDAGTQNATSLNAVAGKPAWRYDFTSANNVPGEDERGTNVDSTFALTVDGDNYATFKIALTDAAGDSDPDVNYYGKWTLSINSQKATDDDNVTPIAVSADIIAKAASETPIDVIATRTAYDGKATLSVVSGDAIKGFAYMYDNGADPSDPSDWTTKYITISSNNLLYEVASLGADPASNATPVTGLAFENANTVKITNWAYANNCVPAGVDITIGGGDPIDKSQEQKFTIKADGTLDIGAIVAAKNTKDAYVQFNVTSENIIKSFSYNFTRGTSEDPAAGYNIASGTIAYDTATAIPHNAKYVLKDNSIVISCDEVTKLTVGNIKVSDTTKYPGYTFVLKANGRYILPNESDPAYAETTTLKNALEFTIPSGTSLSSPYAIELVAIPFKAVTLSVNDAEGAKEFTTATNAFTYEATDGAYARRAIDVPYGDMISTGKYWVDIPVEPGKSVSVNGFAVKNYVDLEISSPAELVEKNNGTVKYWNLGKIDNDTKFTLTPHKYLLFDVIKVNQLDGSYPIVSLDQAGATAAANYTFTGARTNIDDSGKVSTNVVLVNNGSELTIRLTTERGKSDYDYLVDTVTYTNLGGKEVPLTVTRPSWESSQKYSTVTIGDGIVTDILRTNGELTLNVKQRRKAKDHRLELTTAPDAMKGKVEAVVKYNDGINKFEYDGSPFVESLPHGTDVTIEAKAKDGYKITNVSYNELPIGYQTVSGNFSISGTSGSATYQLNVDSLITFNVAENNWLDINYKEGNSTVAKDKSGNYTVYYNRPVTLQYKTGTVAKTFNYVVKVNKKDITNEVSTNAVKLSADKKTLTFDGSNKLLKGKTVTLEITGTAEGSEKITAVFIVDNEKRGISFSAKDKKGVEIAAGATKDLVLTPKQITSANVVISSNSAITAAQAAGLVEFELDTKDYKKLTIKTKAGSYALDNGKKMTVNIVDGNDPSIIYDSVEIGFKDTIKESAAPTVKVTSTTFNTVTVSLKTAKGIDTSLDGLFFEVKATVTPSAEMGSNSPLESKTYYVPVKNTTSYTIDLLKTGATKAQILAGDPKATIKIAVRVVQAINATKVAETTDPVTGRVTKAYYKVAAADIKSSGKVTDPAIDAQTKEGGVFTTKLKLVKAKGNPSKLYTNMKEPYNINVVYDNKATVRQLTSVVINGLTLGTHYYWEDNVITINPGDDTQLLKTKEGTYEIKATALELDGHEVSATMKFKIEESVEDTQISIEANRNTIYKIAGKATTAQLVAYDNSKVGNPRLKKVEWVLLAADDGGNAIEGKTPDFVANKSITIGKSNGKIKIKKDFAVDGTKFIARAYARDFTTNPAKADLLITVKTKFDTNLVVQYAKTAGGVYNDLPASGYVTDIFGSIGTPDEEQKDFKYKTYLTVVTKAEDGTVSYVPADFKVSGAKLIDTYVSDGKTIAKVGFTKFGDIKITAVPTDGTNAARSLKGKTAKKFTVKSYAGNLGFWLYKDYLYGADSLISNNIIMGTTKTSGAIEVPVDAKETAVTLKNYQPAGTVLPIVVRGVGVLANESFTSAIDHTISVKGGSLIKPKNFYGQYEIKPTAYNTIVTFTKKVNGKKASTFKVTIVNEAIGNNKSLKKVTFNKPYNWTSATKSGSNDGKIYNNIYFDDVDAKAKGFATYNQASVNRVKYSLKANYTSANCVLVNVLKDYKLNPKQPQYWGSIEDAVAKSAETVGGTAVQVNGAYLIKLTGKSTNEFTIDYTYENDWDGNPGTDSYVYGIKPGTYKLGVTPVYVDLDKLTVANNECIAKGLENVIKVPVVKTPTAKVTPKAKVTWANKTANAIEKGNYKNYISMTVADSKSKCDVKFIEETDGFNKSGKINKFKANFKVADTDKLTYQGSTALDPTNKDELTGWVYYWYQELSGTVKRGEVKVNLSVPKGGTISK